MKQHTPKPLTPSQIEPARTVYDEIVYIAKGASMRHALRLYRQDGTPTNKVMHPDFICTHDRATWVTYYCPIERKQIPYCPICTPAK